MWYSQRLFGIQCGFIYRSARTVACGGCPASLCEIQHGINFYVRRGSQSATVSVFYTGSIVIGFKKGSTQLRDELLKLKEDIENGKL